MTTNPWPTFDLVGVVEATGENVYRCADCQVLLAGLGAMQEHATWHTWREEKERCPYCGVAFLAPAGHDPLKHHLPFCVCHPDADVP